MNLERAEKVIGMANLAKRVTELKDAEDKKEQENFLSGHLRKAYLKMAVKTHPDTNRKDPEDVATEKFKELRAAYEFVQNEFLPQTRINEDNPNFTGSGLALFRQSLFIVSESIAADQRHDHVDYIDARGDGYVERLGFSISPLSKTLENSYVLTFEAKVVDEMVQVLYNMDSNTQDSYNEETKVFSGDLEMVDQHIVAEYDATQADGYTKDSKVIFNGLCYKRLVESKKEMEDARKELSEQIAEAKESLDTAKQQLDRANRGSATSTRMKDAKKRMTELQNNLTELQYKKARLDYCLAEHEKERNFFFESNLWKREFSLINTVFTANGLTFLVVDEKRAPPGEDENGTTCTALCSERTEVELSKGRTFSFLEYDPEVYVYALQQQILDLGIPLDFIYDIDVDQKDEDDDDDADYQGSDQEDPHSDDSSEKVDEEEKEEEKEEEEDDENLPMGLADYFLSEIRYKERINLYQELNPYLSLEGFDKLPWRLTTLSQLGNAFEPLNSNKGTFVDGIWWTRARCIKAALTNVKYVTPKMESKYYRRNRDIGLVLLDEGMDKDAKISKIENMRSSRESTPDSPISDLYDESEADEDDEPMWKTALNSEDSQSAIMDLLFERQAQSDVTIDMLTLDEVIDVFEHCLKYPDHKGSRDSLLKLLLFCNILQVVLLMLYSRENWVYAVAGHVNYYGSFTDRKIKEITDFKRKLKTMISENDFTHFFAQPEDVETAGVSEELFIDNLLFYNQDMSPGSLEYGNLWSTPWLVNATIGSGSALALNLENLKLGRQGFVPKGKKLVERNIFFSDAQMLDDLFSISENGTKEAITFVINGGNQTAAPPSPVPSSNFSNSEEIDGALRVSPSLAPSLADGIFDNADDLSGSGAYSRPQDGFDPDVLIDAANVNATNFEGNFSNLGKTQLPDDARDAPTDNFEYGKQNDANKDGSPQQAESGDGGTGNPDGQPGEAGLPDGETIDLSPSPSLFPAPSPSPLSDVGDADPLPPKVSFPSSPQFEITATKAIKEADAVRLLYKVDAAINYGAFEEKSTEKSRFEEDYWEEAPKAGREFAKDDIIGTATLKRIPADEFIFDKRKWLAVTTDSGTKVCFCESGVRFIVVDHEENCKLSLLQSNGGGAAG